jgi:exopolysaccharide production protein ExoZ
MKDQLVGIQVLRAIAALAVVAFHFSVSLQQDFHLTARLAFPAGANGVDIFFVISGFIMSYTTARPDQRSPASFVFKRLARIIPLYWVMTLAVFGLGLAAPALFHLGAASPSQLLRSLFFIPYARADGMTEPVLFLGWTLNYEMFFYLVLTPFLLLPRTRAVVGSALALGMLVALGQVFSFGLIQLRFWADPIILEFVAGMGLALAVAAGLSLPGWLRLTLVAVACVALHAQAGGPLTWRVVSFGIPGALLVAAAVSGKRPERNEPAMRSLTRLGDASYAMYLFHPFVMRGFTLLGVRLGTHSETSGIVYVVLSLAVAQLCALAINAGFERKLTAMLRSRSVTARGRAG